MNRLFAFALLLIAVNAWSDNPVPSKAQKATSPQRQATNKDNPSANDKTPAPPRIPVNSDNRIIKLVDVPKTETDTAKAHDNCCDKTPFIWGMTAEEATTIFTFWLAVVGAFTGFVLCWQACLLRGQTRLAREEFIASHRPKIIIRGFRLLHQDMPIGKKINFAFTAQNIGDTGAKIIEYRNGTFIQFAIQNIPSDLSFPTAENLLPNLVLESGVSQLFPGDSGEKLLEDKRTQIYSGKSALYCMGIIVYCDEIGTRRETGFCRRYRPSENRWEVIDCEYEYAY